MVTFCIIVAPLPHKIQKKLFNFLSESTIVAKIAYGLKITFMCVLEVTAQCALRLGLTFFTSLFSSSVAVLFVDALQRMFRITAEAEAAKTSGATIHDARAESSFAARKF